MDADSLETTLIEADQLVKSGSYDLAEQRCRQILASIAPEGSEVSRIRAQLILVNALWWCGRFTEALPVALEAIDNARRIHDVQRIAEGANLLGSVHSDLGNLANALQSYQDALTAYRQLNDRRMTGGVSVNIGATYFALGDNVRALELYQEAIDIFDSIGERAFKAIATGNIGSILSTHGSLDRALEYFERAVSEFNDLGMVGEAAQFTGAIGGLYGSMERYEEALVHFGDALVKMREMGAAAEAAFIVGEIGMVHLLLGDHTTALEHFTEALSTYEQIGSQIDTAMILESIGRVYADPLYAGHDPERAEGMMRKALQMSEVLGAKERQHRVHGSLAALLKQQQRWQEYAAELEQYHALKDEIKSDEATKQAELLEHRRKVEDAERDRQVKIARFMEQEKILHNILPAQIADRILNGEKRIADTYESVSIFFSDIVGFTQLSQNITAEALVTLLDDLFIEFDTLARVHGMEKIKTIGDAYMAVAGAPVPQNDHAARAIGFALDVSRMVRRYREQTHLDLQIRIGLHTGSVVAGVIGENKFVYDLWGDTVNTASRMESHGESGKIHISEDLLTTLIPSYSLTGTTTELDIDIKGMPIHVSARGEIDVKGKGPMRTYFVSAREG